MRSVRRRRSERSHDATMCSRRCHCSGGPFAARQADLGGEQHLVAPSARRERVADDLLALAVDVGGVDEGDPGVDRAVEHDRRFLRRRRITEVHRAEHQRGDADARGAERPEVHRLRPCACERPRSVTASRRPRRRSVPRCHISAMYPSMRWASSRVAAFGESAGSARAGGARRPGRCSRCRPASAAGERQQLVVRHDVVHEAEARTPRRRSRSCR